MNKIYVLRDPITNEIRYVGKTINKNQRFKNHLNSKHNERSHKKNWINKLKEQGLKPIFEVIQELEIDQDWREAEKKWILFYREQGCNLVNHHEGGTGLDFKGNQTSFKKGSIPWNDGKANIETCIVCNKEFPLSFAQIRQGRKTCSHECGSTLKKEYTKPTQFSENHIPWNKDNSGYKTSKRKPVLQLDMEDNILNEFECCKDAAISVNCIPENIRRACVGKSKSAKGFKWKYKN